MIGIVYTPLYPWGILWHEILEDENIWLAKNYGVSLEKFLEWLEYDRSGNQCTAITKKGTQCKNTGSKCYDPNDLSSGITDRCRLHIGKETVVFSLKEY